MAFLDELKDRAMDLGRAGVAKSKQLAEITKLSLNNASEEDAIKKAYVEIGKLYYAEHGSAPDGAYAAACEKITAARAAIETNNDRIAQLKNSSDEDVEVVTFVEANPVSQPEPAQESQEVQEPEQAEEPKSEE